MGEKRQMADHDLGTHVASGAAVGFTVDGEKALAPVEAFVNRNGGAAPLDNLQNPFFFQNLLHSPHGAIFCGIAVNSAVHQLAVPVCRLEQQGCKHGSGRCSPSPMIAGRSIVKKKEDSECSVDQSQQLKALQQAEERHQHESGGEAAQHRAESVVQYHQADARPGQFLPGVQDCDGCRQQGAGENGWWSHDHKDDQERQKRQQPPVFP